MRKPPKNRQRRGLPPPCGIHPAFLGCEELLPRPGRRAFAIPRGKAALLFLVAAGVVRHSLVFGPTCGAPRPTAAGRGRSPRPEALVEGAGTASGAEIAQRYAQPSNQPHQAQGRLEPRPGTKHKNMGFPKGRAPLVAFRPFWPVKMDPSGASPPGWQACVWNHRRTRLCPAVWSGNGKGETFHKTTERPTTHGIQ